MTLTDINSKGRLVQRTFAEHLEKALGWETIYENNAETFGPAGTLAGASERDVVIAMDLRAAMARLILNIHDLARDSAIEDGRTARDLLLRGLRNREIAI
jgi:type I restriction enzyme R subunit